MISSRPLKGLIFLVLVATTPVLAQPNISALRQSVSSNPADVEAWLELGNAYFDSGDFDAARESFYEAVALDYRSGDAHFGLGLSEFERGDFPAALFEFNEVTRLYPERFDGHFNKAVTLAKLRKFDEAAAAFGEAIAQEASDDQRVEAYLGLAGMHKRAQNYSAAAEAYTEAAALRPTDTELAYQRADSLYQAGQGLEALPDLVDLEESSSDYRVSALIADIYVEQDQTDYALRSLERAQRKAQGAADATAQANILVQLGLLQQQLGRSSEASTSFQQAVYTDATAWQAQYHLGVSLLEDGQAASALSALENARTLNPDSAEVYMALALAYEQTGQMDQVMPAAEAAMERAEDPTQLSDVQFVLGRVSYQQGSFEEALSAFEEVVEAQPENALAQLWAGLAEYSLENYMSAVQYLERAVQLEPESVEARANLGASYYQAERYQDAEVVFELMLEDTPTDAEALYNLGLSLMAQNQRVSAREVWVQASDLGYGPAQDALQQYF